MERGEYRGFYWGPGAPRPGAHRFAGFPALLLPGYALLSVLLPGWPPAGRLGAVLTIAACGALLAAQSYRLCRDLGASGPAAAWSALLGALTPPMLVHANHVYPEIPAALAAVVAVRLVLRLPARAAVTLAAVAALALAMIGLKDRYTPLAVGVVAWALLRAGASWPRARAAGLLTLGLAAAVVLVLHPLPSVFPNLRPLPMPPRADVLARAAIGVFADQEFGLFAGAPHWALLVVGAPWLWRRRREALVGLGALVAGYLAALLCYRWMRWYGGATPAPRFALSITPLLAPLVAAAFDHARGRLLAALTTLCVAWSAAVAVAVTAVPAWRYDPPDGEARLLHGLGRALGLDLARFLPSLVMPTWWTWLVLGLGALGLLAWAAASGTRAHAPGAGAPSAALRLLPPRAAVALLAGVAAAWLAAAAALPSWSVPAAAMASSAGVPVQQVEQATPLWLMVADATLDARVVAWPGSTEVAIDAAAYSTTGTAPAITVALGGQSAPLGPLRAGPDGWVAGRYAVRLPAGYGRTALRVAVTGLADDRANGAFQHLALARVVLRPRLPWSADPPADCRTRPLVYCPDAPVTRAELAVLLAEARRWPPYTAPGRPRLAQHAGPATEGPERDREGDESRVTRAELATLLLRAARGPDFEPPAAEGRFDDVAPDSPGAAWIEALGRDRLTCGCGGRRYCPERAVTWGEASAFLARAFPGSYPPSPCRG